MSHEYTPVILEVTPRRVRAGHVGDPDVAVDIATRFATAGPAHVFGLDRAMDPDTRERVWQALMEDPTTDKLWKVDQANRQWLDAVHGDELRGVLKHHFRESLLVTPQRTKVFAIEDGLSALEKYHMATMLVREMKVRSVVFLPRKLMCMMGGNVQTGLLVSIGWTSCVVMPVVDGRILREHAYEVEVSGHRYYLEAAAHLGTDFAGVEAADAPNEVTDPMVKLLVEAIAKVRQRVPIDVRPLCSSVVFDNAYIPEVQDRVIAAAGGTAIYTLGPFVGASVYLTTAFHSRKSFKKAEITKELLKQMTQDTAVNLVGFPQLH